jgi:hypothetical protein
MPGKALLPKLAKAFRHAPRAVSADTTGATPTCIDAMPPHPLMRRHISSNARTLQARAGDRPRHLRYSGRIGETPG